MPFIPGVPGARAQGPPDGDHEPPASPAHRARSARTTMAAGIPDLGLAQLPPLPLAGHNAWIRKTQTQKPTRACSEPRLTARLRLTAEPFLAAGFRLTAVPLFSCQRRQTTSHVPRCQSASWRIASLPTWRPPHSVWERPAVGDQPRGKLLSLNSRTSTPHHDSYAHHS